MDSESTLGTKQLWGEKSDRALRLLNIRQHYRLVRRGHVEEADPSLAGGGFYLVTGLGCHPLFRLGCSVYYNYRGHQVRALILACLDPQRLELEISFTISLARSRPRCLSEALTSTAMSISRRVFS